MIVYFSASARDIDNNFVTYLKALTFIREAGGILAQNWVEALYMNGSPKDPEWWERLSIEAASGIQDADIVIVEGSGQSAFGVGFETANALHLAKPTLLLIEEGRKNSYGVGIKHPQLQVSFYNDNSLQEVVKGFLTRNGL